MEPRFPNQITREDLTHEQIAVLTSVACNEVFEALTFHEAFSIRELSLELGKSTASIGEHIAKLLEVGLIIPAGTRQRRARTETLYVQKAYHHMLELRNLPEETLQEFLTKFRCDMRHTDRTHVASQYALRKDSSLLPYMNYMTFTGYINLEGMRKLAAGVRDLHALYHDLIETDPEVRAKGEYMRIKFSTLTLPTIRESEKRTK